jgi:hypothetical protein
MKHTPTPWQIGSKVPNFIYARDGLDIIAQCDSWNESTRAEENANAAHIVRCVNAHDALVAALELCDGYLTDAMRLREHARTREVWESARAALKLAKGE